ncbi:MAG: hypothetical protein P4L46_26290 [Fimbriimonas sp.]|nr:hypothetical protein [Fimbriimonas sp.]
MIARIIGTFCVLATACSLHAQGVFAKPVSVEMTVKPGEVIDLPFVLRNNQPDATNSVKLGSVYLIQSLNGFEGVDADKVTPEIVRNFPSCYSWLRLPSERELTMAPLVERTVHIRISVPASAHGFYCGMATVTSQRVPAAPGMAIIVRLLIPIVLNVGSGVTLKGGKVIDAVATYVAQTKNEPARTRLACVVKNTGNALSRYGGKANLFQIIGGRRRRIIAASFDDRGIVPNATVAISANSQKLIPSGTYRIETQMTMDGQKMPPFGRDVVVEGDPKVTAVAADLEMMLSPDPVEFDVVPGAFRGLSFQVQNSGVDPIVVDATVATPKVMQGVSGPLGTGESLSLAPWCAEPITGVLIRGGETKSLRMPAAMPSEGLRNSAYYGELNVVAKTQDGAFVGSSKLLMIARNKRVPPTVSLASQSEIQVSSVSANIYSFMAKFVNNGSEDVAPEVEARITDPSRIRTILRLPVGETLKRLLPLESIRPSGNIDVRLLKDGVYLLEMTVKAGNIGESKTVGLKVATANKAKTLTVIVIPKEGAQRATPPAVKKGGG